MASMKFLVDILDLINEKKQSLRTHIVGLVAEVNCLCKYRIA